MKDAKGHGSDKRGAAGADERYAHVMASTKAASDNLQKLIDQHATGGQPVTSNAHAAATLASGSKSASVDTHPAMQSGDGRQYFGNVKVGRSNQTVGPHTNREAATTAAFALNPKAKTVSTGYGYKGSFDMRWHNRGDQ